MTANYSCAQTRLYQPTIIENKLLLSRLAIQIAFVKNDPVGFFKQSLRDLMTTRNALFTLLAVAAVVLFMIETRTSRSQNLPTVSAQESLGDMVMLDVRHGPGRVGFNEHRGEGSGPSPRRAQGGGSGGDRNPIPPQTGKLPPPSAIPAAIPITPPRNPPALPVAGIDVDPALWKDLSAPVYGDPKSSSETPSKGPGDGGGIGTNIGPGVGTGSGPGYGPGEGGNMGDGPKQLGCCGTGGSANEGGTFKNSDVDQRARLLSKPEPHYTEEARRNQISGTVLLRVVFSSAGEVVQIRALHTLPFGLTERAIAAARQITFVPAMKNGRPVSVHMQLEYNFNLY
ncbi:MAG TPA: TonB family protein [Pyrinomonadaceae bacterium]|nr:TonB family protein [Pyrinomonadaceae bacterium]